MQYMLKYLKYCQKNTGNLTKLLAMLNYEDLILQRNTCSDDKTEQKCNCNICLTARSQRLKKNQVCIDHLN